MNFFKHLSKIFLLFFFLAQAGTLKAQTYQPMAVDSNKWYHYGNLANGSGIQSYDTVIFEIVKDTFALGKSWKKFHYYGPPAVFAHFEGLMRDDSVERKVWFKMLPPFTEDTSEILYFDFNLAVGDTFWLEGWYLDTLVNMTGTGCNPATFGALWYSDTYNFERATHPNVIMAIDSVLLGGVWRRRVTTAAYGTFFQTEWVEGIGSLWYGPMYHFAKNISGVQDITFSCMTQKKDQLLFSQTCNVTASCSNAAGWFPNTSLCDGMIVSKEDSYNQAFKLYPNPAKDLIQAEYPLGMKHLYIYDMQGKKIWESGISGTRESLRLHLAPGTYHVLVSDEKRQFTQKLMISKQ